LGLDRGPEGVGEPLRRLHDNVDEVAAADQAQLGTRLSRSAIACMTSALVFSRTPGRWLSTRSTVTSLSPDCCAISRTL
jgi:hypothetical protein